MSAEPKLVVRKGLNGFKIDMPEAVNNMHKLGLKDETILNTTIYIDNFPHFTVRGSACPKAFSRIRFPYLKTKDHILRISTRMIFSGSTQDKIDHIFIHEVAHLRQFQNQGYKVLIGNVTELVFFVSGLLLGLTDNSGPLIWRILITIIVALFFLQVGYMLAWHEIDARRTSKNYELKKKIITWDIEKTSGE